MTLLFGLYLSLPLSYPASPDAMADDIRLKAIAATVRVFNPVLQTKGSGVILASDGPFVYVLTANHVVSQAQEVDIQIAPAPRESGSMRTSRGAVVARVDGMDDLALVRVRMRERVPGQVRVCPPAQVPGEVSVPVLAIGWQSGPGPTCHPDSADKKRVRRLDGTTGILWQVASPNAAGRSGGPLFDKRGLLIGIASGTSEGKGYFSHVEAIHAFLRHNGYKFLYEEVKN